MLAPLNLTMTIETRPHELVLGVNKCQIESKLALNLMIIETHLHELVLRIE